MEEVVLACNMSVFNRDQRERYEHLAERIFTSPRSIRELADGYAFELADDPSLLVAVAEWITLERLCCPFLSFELSLAPNDDATLSLRGPSGVKEFLRAEFRALGTSQAL